MIDKYDMLELFENEPKVIDEEAGMYEYQRKDKYGFTLELSLFVYDRYCSVTLSYEDFTEPLFNIGFHEVDVINCKCKDNKLVIRLDGSKKDAVIYFKPNYTFVFEERLT